VITSTAFAGQHYAVLGLARSGRATVDALLASGAKVTAWDDNSDAREGAVDAVQAASHDWNDFELAIEDFVAADLSAFDSIVVTPGLPLNRHPIATAAAAAGVEIIGDIELFARARAELPPHKVIGITGTNGKSTTTALVHHILESAGVPTLMGGNIGLPILAQDPLPRGGIYVLELSSYQIDLTASLDCDVAVLLNITPDHLDRYADFDAYARSKLRLFDMQSTGRPVLIGDPNGPEDDLIGEYLDDLHAAGKNPAEHQVLMDAAWDKGTSFSDGALWIDGRRIAPQADWPALQGPHNAWNASIAATACQLVGLDLGAIVEGLQTYAGLPHRMERVTERHGVQFVNDSKATNAEAAAPALAAFHRVRWIVGGQAKAKTLGDTARHLDHVVKAYAIGEAAGMFAALLRDADVDVAECGTLEAAVKAAAADARPGDTVLLSPACASFDQFKDFEARGDAFRAAVEAL
jgi:UDP-N-acetylmuramoylalanine--D-glutamate ligase